MNVMCSRLARSLSSSAAVLVIKAALVNTSWFIQKEDKLPQHTGKSEPLAIN